MLIFSFKKGTLKQKWQKGTTQEPSTHKHTIKQTNKPTDRQTNKTSKKNEQNKQSKQNTNKTHKTHKANKQTHTHTNKKNNCTTSPRTLAASSSQRFSILSRVRRLRRERLTLLLQEALGVPFGLRDPLRDRPRGLGV